MFVLYRIDGFARRRDDQQRGHSAGFFLPEVDWLAGQQNLELGNQLNRRLLGPQKSLQSELRVAGSSVWGSSESTANRRGAPTECGNRLSFVALRIRSLVMRLRSGACRKQLTADSERAQAF
ncbi:MAG: hypothetical protein L0226_07675 [Acidobacteria bacterium]|nr:hypothetical protein [Acidobacteriota bacterium]